MGWPEKTPELEYFYPTSLMVTGFDIIFFWVARMIMMGLEFMDEEPFKDVYIHSLIRDEHGQKMSKSKGNVIDPLDMIDKYGADALRMALAALSTQGRDILLSQNKIETYRFFMNKLWNAARFALINTNTESKGACPLDLNNLHSQDHWILSRLQEIVEQETRMLDEYDVGSAARLLYDFVWGDFCDWYLEMAKPALKGDEGEARKETTQAVLSEVFKTLLPLLHPFIPFVTEELWEAFGEHGYIMTAAWPKPKDEYRFDCSSMQDFQGAVRILRNLRAEAHVAPQQWMTKATVRVDRPETVTVLKEMLSLVSILCRVKEIEILPASAERQPACLSSVYGEGEISLHVGDVLDISAEAERLKLNLAAIEKTVAASQSRLDKADFVSRAPADVVEKERARVTEGQAQMARLRENLDSLTR